MLSLLVGSVTCGHAQYLVGDHGATASGSWTVLGTWSTWNGAAWVPAASLPGITNRVHILTGRTVTVPATGPYPISDLFVETGAKLWTTNNLNNIYISIYGSTLQCDGQIGDGANFDGIAFNIEGTNVTLQGTGQFDASRLRKNFNANYTTNLTIAMDINLRFQTGSTTQMYINYAGACVFNVTINAGVTVNLTGSSGTGNIAMNGVDGSSNLYNRGGTYWVNGSLIVPGILYLTTGNNTGGGNFSRMVIGPGGTVQASTVSAAPSGAAGHQLEVQAGGTLEITGTPSAWSAYSTVNNTYTLNAASNVIYSGAGDQNVPNISLGYGGLTISGSGVRSLMGVTLVKGNLLIENALGSPVLDVTASNFQLTLQGHWTNYAESGFNERSGVVILSLAAPQTILTPGGERFHILRLAKTLSVTSMITMACDVTLVNALELNTGMLDLNAHRLILLNGLPTAITSINSFGALRHIRSERTDHLSKVQWNIGNNTGVHLIPFGNPSGATLFVFDLTSGNAGEVVVSTYNTPPDNLPWPTTPTLVTNLYSTIGLLPDNRDATVDRFWQVDVSGSPIATLTFSYLLGELPLAPYDTPFQMQAQRYTTTVDQWLPATPGQTSTAYSVTAPGLTQFGPFALAAQSSPLPVEFLSFSARDAGDHVLLEWSTATEQDNDHFLILRSSDGELFTPIGHLPGAGNSQQQLDYHWKDIAPMEGLSYYKIRQVDLDGQFQETSVAAIHRRSGTLLFPNPTADVLHISGPDLAGAQVIILDAVGRELRSLSLAQETERATLPVQDLSPGPYLLMLRNGESVRSMRFQRR